MKAEDIFKLLREGSKDVMEGLETLEAFGKTLSAAAQQGKKLVEIGDRISKRIPPQKP